jgi:Rho-binding antiterminator
MTYRPIDCTLHDHLEIACLFHYQVQLKLKNGATVTGEAQTTTTWPNRSETLAVLTKAGTEHVPLEQLSHMLILTENARFLQVDFENTPPTCG